MRNLRAGSAAALGLAAIALSGGLVSPPASAATQSGPQRFAAIANSVNQTGDPATGSYTSSRMSVEIALAPRDQGALNRELTALYTPGSSQYHQFLATGQFDQRYAPAAPAVSAVAGYLRGQGLAVSGTGSPFLLRASGSSAQISGAFRTTLSMYSDARGTKYFANSAPIQIPVSLKPYVLGVVGLTDTIRQHPLTARAQAPAAARKSCENRYPTRQALFAQVKSGKSFVAGYGGGPHCSGLTPSQTNSVYGAPKASAKTKGAGRASAIFELSGYKASDPKAWGSHFYGKSYRPAITNIKVDGGATDDSGDIEVTSDIDQEMAVAPKAHLYVYSAPNDNTGQGSLDEYSRIAKDDAAATVSTSWGLCESDAGQAYAQAESTFFKQMAAQGQSVFAAAGDSGALDCIRGSGNTAAAVDDPGSQPWVTSTGGTSLETFNPGTKARPAYPRQGTETVWNPSNLCTRQGDQPDNDNLGGAYWCGSGTYETGAGGGGSSRVWGAPSWQKGPGVSNRYTKYGTANCALAGSSATPCRQVPDISADADEFTPYSTYCTGGTGMNSSECPALGSGGGWMGIGGTSLAAPLWAALITDRDSYKGRRSGNANPLLYGWLRKARGTYFHDIAKPGKSGRAGVVMAANNGIFPTTGGYDEATGIGTPRFAAIIKR